MTLYADLLQQVEASDVPPGSISVKTVGGRRFLYAVEREGRLRKQRFLGPAENAEAQGVAEAVRNAEAQAKQRRSTVSALKRASIQAPAMQLGHILQAIAAAGLFRDGLTLVGTSAYRLYPAVVGCFLSNAALMTNDLDISAAAFLAKGEARDLEAILQKADPTFKAHMSVRDRLPKVFRSRDGFSVELVTKHGRGRTSPVDVPLLTASAEALSFQEFLAEETMHAVALHGPGVLVRVPVPARYAVHKLIVAAMRAKTNPKRRKDLMQAGELIDILAEIDPDGLQDTLEAARERGRSWQTRINASLAEMGRESRKGRLPLLKGS